MSKKTVEIYVTRVRQRLLTHDTESTINTTKTDELGFIDMFCTVKENKTSHRLGEKHLQITFLTKGLYSQYIKSCQNSTIRKQTTYFKKWAKCLNRHLFEEATWKANNT